MPLYAAAILAVRPRHSRTAAEPHWTAAALRL